MNIQVWTPQLKDYKLLDSGDKQKLEQVGSIRIVRSEPRAWWTRSLPQPEWDKADAEYIIEVRGEWQFKKPIQDFTIEAGPLKAKIGFTKNSKHIGIFPEQLPQWEWIQNQIKNSKREINVLSLFGYTGLATLAAAQAGAKVTHVDASKPAVTWARENQNLSGLNDKPIRWLIDDAMKFVKKEINRGKKYEAIIMDPPAFGRGPQGQVWKIEKDLADFLKLCKQVLSDDPQFIMLTTYAIDSSSLSIGNLLDDLMKGFKGQIEVGELAIAQENSHRLLSLSIFGAWAKN